LNSFRERIILLIFTMRKIISVKSAITILVICLALICCKKDANRYLISGEFKQYTTFKMGSYWIYKNDVTNQTDSSYIIDPPFDNIIYLPNTPRNEVFWQQISYQMHNPFMGVYTILAKSNSEYLEVGTKLKKVAPLLIKYSESGFEVTESIPTYTINGVTFTDVLHTQTYRYPLLNSDTLSVDAYFAKSVGILKFHQRTTTSDTSWSIITFHTIQ